VEGIRSPSFSWPLMIWSSIRSLTLQINRLRLIETAPQGNTSLSASGRQLWLYSYVYSHIGNRVRCQSLFRPDRQGRRDPFPDFRRIAAGFSPLAGASRPNGDSPPLIPSSLCQGDKAVHAGCAWVFLQKNETLPSAGFAFTGSPFGRRHRSLPSKNPALPSYGTFSFRGRDLSKAPEEPPDSVSIDPQIKASFASIESHSRTPWADWPSPFLPSFRRCRCDGV